MITNENASISNILVLGRHILHILYATIDNHINFSGGGIASYVMTVGQELINIGHQVTMIAKSNSFYSTDVNGINVVCVPFGNLHWYFSKVKAPSLFVHPVRELEWSINMRRAIETIRKRSNIDVIEGCETGIAFLGKGTPPFTVRLHGEPYIFSKYSEHSISPGLKATRIMELAALRKATVVTSPSKFQANEMAVDLGWEPHKIRVIPNPINGNIIKKSDGSKKRLKEQIVLYTGRIEKRKGTIQLINGIPYVVKKNPKVKFVIAGGRHSSINDLLLNSIISDGIVQSHLILLGHIQWDKLSEWYQSASVFVMPSLYETFGISVIEAMAYGLPIVATRAGGLSEVVDDGVNGILVPPGDVEALAEAINTLLANENLRTKMGAAGREKVLSQYNACNIANELLAVYKSIIL